MTTTPTCLPRDGRRGWGDDSGLAAIAVTIMLVIVVAGGGLIYDGGRALTARRQVINVAEAAARAGAATATAEGLDPDVASAATTEFLNAAGINPGDVIAVTVTATTVTVTLHASRTAVFGQLLGNRTIVVQGTGRASARFGGSP